MSEELNIPEDASDEDKYLAVLSSLKGLLSKEEPLVANLANTTAVLKEVFPKISWVGFYLYDGSRLYLGPFQGKLACTWIALGKGVCGKAAQDRETVIVKNVHQFPGHIACDAGSNSEIVVPIIHNGNLLGVLDLDSYRLSAFNRIDKKFLEEIIAFIVNEIISENDPLFSGLFAKK
ncbi:MAG: GAF domain-containing protein [Ignavibacteriales bacterium]|nr:GAF domain-containing protein [Ignavibacteriales bacterium]